VRLVSLTDLDLWFRVRHREFSPNRLYRALAFADYGPTANACIVFVTDKGYLWFVKQSLAVADAGNLCTAELGEEALPPWPKEKPKSDLQSSTGL
jgi:hypothetical protein